MHRSRGQKGGGPKALLQVKVLVKPLELYPKKIDQRLVHHQHPTREPYEVWECHTNIQRHGLLGQGRGSCYEPCELTALQFKENITCTS